MIPNDLFSGTTQDTQDSEVKSDKEKKGAEKKSESFWLRFIFK